MLTSFSSGLRYETIRGRVGDLFAPGNSAVPWIQTGGIERVKPRSVSSNNVPFKESAIAGRVLAEEARPNAEIPNRNDRREISSGVDFESALG